ncbi:PPOX class F420-dependent oxidoreductase [Streptomyces sp. ODS28]|uniref:PPOX class F420-dependent oxidoreductase n=1 Tax=Streptomyces sp. ODS28 TaxID=3136688 RepID=UPI0031E73982
MAHTMSDEEWRAFVSAGTRTGKLATTRADGSPHVAPVWFLLDNDEIVFNTGADTVKGRNLARDGRAVLCVDDDDPPYAFATLQGEVSLHDDLAEMLPWATRIAARYVGEARAEEFGRRNAVAGELLVRMRVKKVVALADMTG